MAGGVQDPLGEAGLSFRADKYFPVADDFAVSSADPIVAVRWWGSIGGESAPHEPLGTEIFYIGIYEGGAYAPGELITEYYVEDAAEAFTGVYCKGSEGYPGYACPGLEPLYEYEAELDPPFVPQPGVSYWIAFNEMTSPEMAFWSIHEGAVPHPTGAAAATWGMFDWDSGVMNDCPNDYSGLIGPYDLAFELIVEQACLGDLDDDGVVGRADLKLLITSRGPCPGCSADLDGSGVVDRADLKLLLSAWGACP